MRKIIADTWPLFFGLSILMLANGLQGTLLGVRAGLEGFSVPTIGLVMSCYYIGFLSGSIMAPHLVERVGHIRVFAALASIASVTVLLHVVSDNPVLWGVFRILTGFGYAGLFVVVESWLNNAANKKTRGTLLASYMMTSYAGLIFGQYLINIANPAAVELFVITSALVSLSMVPLALIPRPAPDFEAPEIISLRQLLKLSPQGVYGVFASGMQGGAVLTIGAVYAYQIGFNTPQIANFMAFFILGGVVMQYPLGMLSDRVGRQLILTMTALVSAALAFTAFLFEGSLAGNIPAIHGAVFLIGGFSFPIYALSIAHVNDKLSSRAMTRASGKLILVNGAGAIVGPVLTTLLMVTLGNAGFFLTIAIVHAVFTLLSLWRTIVSRNVPVAEQSEFTPMPARISPVMSEMVETEDGG